MRRSIPADSGRSAPVVLLVEDNSELRHVLKEALAGEGYQVLGARDPAEALEVLRASTVHLLISDLADSPASERALEELHTEFPHLPVVALSDANRGHPTLFFAGWEAGGGYRALTRPFRLGELLAVSREVLGAV